MVLDLGDSNGVKVELTKKQAETLIKMFKRVQADVDKQILNLGDGKSANMRLLQLESVKESMNRAMAQAFKVFEKDLDKDIAAMASSVLKDDLAFLSQFGIVMNANLCSAPVDVLSSIKFGKIYDKKWFLSDAIWGDVKEKQNSINDIIARGVAAGKSTLQIAQDLEKYVDPSAEKPWNWSKVYPNSGKKIDYNAQRLARTAVNHAYELSVVRAAKHNPLQQGIRWMSALSERSCEICIDRDGKIFAPDDLPLDHPNGLCTFSVELPTMDEIAERLGDWVNGKQDEQLDEYYSSLIGGKTYFSTATPKSNSVVPKSATMNVLNTVTSKVEKKVVQAAKSTPKKAAAAKAQKTVKVVHEKSVVGEVSSAADNVYSKTRKDSALWFKEYEKRVADAKLRGVSGDVWKTLSDEQRAKLVSYTGGNSHEYNGLLRSNSYEKVKEFAQGGSYNTSTAQDILKLEDAINLSSYADDIWLQRGIGNFDAVSKFIDFDMTDLAVLSEEELRSRLLGKVIRDQAFCSTGAAKGAGFEGTIFNIYAPSGTKMIYAEPFSRFGGDRSYTPEFWDGVMPSKDFGNEFEMILQRNTTFRITKLEKVDSKFFFDLEIIGQGGI
jgi:SPP1 gp7 family putative phage head morphogenesis protein